MVDKLIKYGVINELTAEKIAEAGASLVIENRPIIILGVFVFSSLLIYGLSGRNVVKSLIAGFASVFALSGFFIIITLS